MSAILGQSPDSSSERDAVHVAVIPVRHYGLLPGSKVTITDRHSSPMEVSEPMGDEFDGILDPFDNSGKDISWMLVSPNRVASGVRHAWDLNLTLAEDIEPRDGFCCEGQRY
jgi:hypothetical protein